MSLDTSVLPFDTSLYKFVREGYWAARKYDWKIDRIPFTPSAFIDRISEYFPWKHTRPAYEVSIPIDGRKATGTRSRMLEEETRLRKICRALRTERWRWLSRKLSTPVNFIHYSARAFWLLWKRNVIQSAASHARSLRLSMKLLRRNRATSLATDRRSYRNKFIYQQTIYRSYEYFLNKRGIT